MQLDPKGLTMCYSKKEYGDMYLSKNFQVKEFASGDGTDPVLINILLPFICQIVRNWSGKPFSPNSAYRTTLYNASNKVDGAVNSLHVYGNAVDIPTPKGKTATELYNFLDMILGDSCELFKYSWGCHVGIQANKERGNG